MKKSVKNILINVVYAAVVLGIAFGVWAVAAAAVGSQFILPDIRSTFDALGTLFFERSFAVGLAGTLFRCALGYAISVAIFFVLFFFSTAFKGFGRVAEPIVAALRTLPTLALSLILAVWVGGYTMPVVLGVLVIMPILYSSAKARIATIDRELGEICVILGAGKWQKFRALWFPHLAAALPESLASAFSYNIKAVIGAEILASTADSLGMLMNGSYAYLQTANLIALTLVAVVVSVACEFVLRTALGVALKKYRD